jgi:hypothetical protein
MPFSAKSARRTRRQTVLLFAKETPSLELKLDYTAEWRAKPQMVCAYCRDAQRVAAYFPDFFHKNTIQL